MLIIIAMIISNKNNQLIFSHNQELYLCKLQKDKNKLNENNFIELYNVFTKSKFVYHVTDITPISIENFNHANIRIPVTNSVIRKKDFDLMKSLILNKHINKAVWFNEYNFKVEDKEIEQIISNAIRNYSDNLIIIRTDEFISITNSPELLLDHKDDKIVIDAIAGTTKNPEELSENKYQEEHNNVIENIKNRISNLTNSVEQKETKTIPYKEYYHLKTELNIPDSFASKEIIQTIAPTSAVFGDPYESVLKYSENLDYYKHNKDSLYAGCIHIKINTIDKVVVNIRNITIKQNIAKITTGCGLTKDSEYSKELFESQIKRNSVLGFINANIQ